jgi:hypothetical protein
MRSLCLLLRKMLSKVMPGLQQFNGEAHPRLQRRAGRLQVAFGQTKRDERAARQYWSIKPALSDDRKVVAFA